MAKSNAYPQTVVSLTGETDVSRVIQQTPSGTAVFEAAGNIYITEIHQSVFNQRIEQKYQNVYQNIKTIKNYPAGVVTGQLQYQKNGNFATTTELTWNETTNTLNANGTINARSLNLIGTGLISSFDAFTSNLLTVAKFQAVQSADLGDISDIAIAGGTVAAGNAGMADAFMKTDGAGNLAWATVNYVETANFANFAGNVTVNAQPNIESLANTVQVGNLELHGEAAQPYVMAYAGRDMSIRADDGAGTTSDLTVTTTGNVVFPISAEGNTAIKSTTGIKIRPATSEFLFNTDGSSDLANKVTANFFNGVLTVQSNAQPNITSVGNLLSLTVANVGTGNITSDNANLGNLVTANYANIAETVVANTANISNLFISSNANIQQVNAVDVAVSGNVIVSGNLFVDGTSTTVNSTSLELVDPLITLGTGANGATLSANDGKDRGLLMDYYTTSAKQAFLGWDNSNAEFTFASEVTEASDTIAVTTLGNIRAGYIFAALTGDLTGNLVNGNSSVNVAANGNVVLTATSNATMTITDTGANITGTANITGNLVAPNIDGGNLVKANYFTGNLVDGTSSVTMTTDGNVKLTVASTDTVVVTATGANIDGTANITGNVIAPNFVGVLANGTSNVSIVNNGNVKVTAAGNTTLTVTATGANISGTTDITGNLSAGNAAITGNLSAANLVGLLANGISNVNIVQDANVKISAGGVANVVDVSDTDLYAIKIVTPIIDVTSAIATTSTSLTIANANATTINFAGAATTLNMGKSGGTSYIKSALQVSGNLTSNATTFNIGTTGTGNIALGNATSTVTIANNVVVTANANVANLNATANVQAANVNTTDLFVTANANVTGNLNVTANANVTANITGGNITTAGTANIATLEVTGTSNLNAVGNITITGGTNLQFLQTDGSGVLKFANITWGNSTTGLTDKTGSSGPTAIALGKNAGNGTSTISFGENAGSGSQGSGAVAIGKNAGSSGQGAGGVAIGNGSGETGQGAGAVGIGVSAGTSSQGDGAVAIGDGAGGTSQSTKGVAVGKNAGATNQGQNSVALGHDAGTSNQHDRSIIINASAGSLESSGSDSLFVKPIRTVGSIAANDHTNNGFTVQLWYNPTTGEIGAFTA